MNKKQFTGLNAKYTYLSKAFVRLLLEAPLHSRPFLQSSAMYLKWADMSMAFLKIPSMLEISVLCSSIAESECKLSPAHSLVSCKGNPDKSCFIKGQIFATYYVIFTALKSCFDISRHNFHFKGTSVNA